MATSTAPDDELPRGIARFWSADGRVTGTGFLIAERTLCTCAHVVASALGTDETAAAPPTTAVTVDFPLLHRPWPRLGAQVTHWHPVTPDGGGDIALLALASPVPGTAPVRFAGGTAIWDHAFRVLGFPLLTDDHGVWVDGRLRAPVGKGWTSMEARPTPGGPTVGRGFSGGPVWDTEQGGVVGMTVAADTGTGATTAYLIPAALILGLDPALRPSPFRGLEAFREQDAAVFFARRADSERIAEALRTHPFVPVTGASGVGKSSLVRAGVLPLLRSSGHTVTDFAGQPDMDPVRTLAEALAGQFPAVRDLARHLSQDREAATLLGARILEHSGTAGHVILLDQFEETVGARPADGRALLDALLPMARAVHPAGRRLRVLATLRSASLEELVTGGRAEALSGTVQMVAPMTRTQLGEVVRLPIDAIPGIEFEPGLAELIVTDAGGEPGALPLVEFALAELWDRQHHGRLTHAAYREIGGVEGALSRYADQQLAKVCKDPDGPEEATARRLFERLARPVRGKEYARVARAFDQLPPELRTAAQALAATRLLVISRDSSGKETVALAHEALVRQWPTLRDWLDESHVFLAWHEKLRGRVREWEEAERHADLLLRGSEVAMARARESERPDELADTEREFIALSRRHRLRTVRRSRTAMVLVACLVAVAAVLSLVSLRLLRGGQESDEQEAARQLAGYADSRSEREPVEAALLALSALRTSDVPEARQAVMRRALPLSRATDVRRMFPEGEVEHMAASADGRTVAVLHRGSDREAHVFVLRIASDGRLSKGEQPQKVPERANAVAVSDDGTKIAAGGLDGVVRVWRTGRAIPEDGWVWSPAPDAWRSQRLDFSTDGDLLLHSVSAGSGYVCDAPDAEHSLYIRDLAHNARRTLPDGFYDLGECVSDVALAASGGPDRVEAVTEKDVGTEDETKYEYRLKTGELSGGADHEIGRSGPLDKAMLGTGGRMSAHVPVGGDSWRVDPHGSAPHPSRGRLDAPGSQMDTSGRFVAMGETRAEGTSERTAGHEYRDAMPLVIEDSHTAKRYGTVVPVGVSGEFVTVLPGTAHRAPLVFAVQGRDVLVFSTLSSEYPLTGGLLDVEDVGYGPAGEHLVDLLGSDYTGEESELASTRDGKERKRLKTDQGVGAVVASANGRRVVVWGSGEWQLWKAPALKSVTGQSSPTKDGETVSETELGITGVEPLGREDFLLLGRTGLTRLHGADGRLTHLSAPDCPTVDTSSDTQICLAAAQRPGPGNEDEIVVLRRNGQAELWDLRQQRPGPKARLGWLDELDWSDRDFVFRKDGEVAAVTTKDGVTLWWPDTKRTKSLGAETRVVGPFRADGRTLVVARPTAIAREATESLELWDTEDVGRIAELRLWSPWDTFRVGRDSVSAESELGWVSLPLGPLYGAPDGMCALLADYPVDDVKDLLEPTEKVRAEADTRPPCPHR